jgi:uncharacterized protein
MGTSSVTTTGTGDRQRSTSALGLGPQLRGRPWFVAATALVALHVVDDNFLQPAPGTGPLDHLVSGLVPLLVIALCAWGYLTLRAGARAVLAIAMGVFGLVVASEAGYYTYAVGPSGDDFTGWLAGLAGLVLVGIGVADLWRSRRHTPNPWWRYARRALLTATAVVVGYTMTLVIGVAYVSTHVARAEVPEAELGAAHEDVTLRTSDGLELAGWYVPSTNGAAVIAFPGRSTSGTQAQTRMLVEHGYGVLLFDRRGEGESEGDGNMFGWGGERDIVAALDYLEDRPDVDPHRIGGIGLSVGGELMLQAAAQDDRLAAVVSEGAGTRSLREEVHEFEGVELATALPALALKTTAVSVFSNRRPPPSLLDLVPRIAPRETLFIWAPNGGNVEGLNPRYHQLAGDASSIWEIDDARHIRGLATHPAEYERRVIGFFDDAL